MTVTTTTNKIIWAGNGATKTFSYSFPIPNSASIVVVYTDATGSQTTLGSTQYTITGVGGTSGGTLTYPITGSAIAVGTSLTMYRVVPYTQSTSLTNQGAFYPQVVEGMSDYLTYEVQQLADQLARTVKINIADTSPSTDLPPAAQRAGLGLVCDASGNITVGAISGTAVSAAMIPVVQAASTSAAAALLGATTSAGSYTWSAAQTFSQNLTLSKAVNEALASSVASAATVNLDNMTGNFGHITGTTTITAITLAAGSRRTVTFDGILTLTHNGTTLILPTAANISTAAGDSATFVGDSTGVRCISYQRANGQSLVTSNIPSIQGLNKNLQVAATAAAATGTVSYDEIILEDGSNNYTILRNGSLSFNTATSGANGLDTGTVAISTFYSVWVIYNGTTTACLLSLSATSPTMPSTYTFKARVGWVRTSTTASQFRGSIQLGRKFQYIVDGTLLITLPTIASGNNSGVMSLVSLTGITPSTATVIRVHASCQSGSNWQFAVAPNANYAGVSTTSPAPIYAVGATNQAAGVIGDITLEAASLYWMGTNSNVRILVLGWEDNI